MDISLSVFAILIAKTLTDSTNVMMLAGFAAVVGHNWSIFIKLKGGLGATAIFGALVVIVSWPILYGLLAGGIILFLTRKPGLSTAVGILTISGTIMIQNGIGALAMYPLILFSLMLLKRLQVSRLPRTSL